MGEVQQEVVVPLGLITERPCNPWFIGIQRWNKAEKAVEEIISKFQPTELAEKKRITVINYLQRLLKGNLGCEVFAYGSVPLKTYLPDGDIDLSVVGASSDYLVDEIASLLESEAKNTTAEFIVKDVQLISAEVKLVKCIVQNIVVDISVNQIGGLCALCFLEQVDRFIGKDHLFKRSIILIKAWCYYESRTLGAHVGLISTYGLETLILYIFHVFHIVLDGPLSVLYKFLEYFSAFDWDNYGISLMGPVRLSALPKIVAERPPNSHDLLLKVGFLRHCSETFSVPTKAGDMFYRKHLNILDPLKDDNNLGRSVSEGNFFRIRSAFRYGARKLKQILTAPGDNVADELCVFFLNTLNIQGNRQIPDLQDPILRSSLNVSEVSKAISGADKSFNRAETGQQRSSRDENSSAGSGVSVNQSSSEGKDVSDPKLGNVGIPFYAPHLFFQYSKLVDKKTETGDIVDTEQTESHEKVVASSVQVVPLDLTGDLSAHLVCLDQLRWWWAPPAMPGPPPPPFLISMIASEHGGVNRVSRHPHFHQILMPRRPFVPKEPIPRGPNGFVPLPEGVAEFAPITHRMPPREPLLHRTQRQNPNRARRAESTQTTRTVSGTDRLTVQSSYHLKDEDDFPPLSV